MIRSAVRWSCVVAGVVLYVYADEIAGLVTGPSTPPAPEPPPGSPVPAVEDDLCRCGHTFRRHTTVSGSCCAETCPCPEWHRV